MMDTAKRKTVIIAVLACLAVAGAAIWWIVSSKKNAPLYGTFEYTNADGSVATVTITEQNVHFENVDFIPVQEDAAVMWAVDEFKEAEKELDHEELEQRQDELMSDMDFAALFQGKTIDYTKIEFSEAYSQYIYYIINDETGPYGFTLCVDLDSKTLSLAGMLFTLQKDK